MIAQLGMYPFPHLRAAQDTLWSAVRRRLGDAPDLLDDDVELHAAWRHPDLIVGQTCGWPLVDQLADVVEVVGAFDVVAPFASGGWYRSVLVASKPLGIEAWKADPATVVARNSPDSLSGWVSLQSAWGGVPVNVLHTGAHIESMRAIASGEAQVACIDGLSFQFIVESNAFLGGRVNVIGHGPRIPSLPLVMSKRLASRRDEVRAAFAAAVADPVLAPTLARLRIRGFVPFELADYEPLRELLPTH